MARLVSAGMNPHGSCDQRHRLGGGGGVATRPSLPTRRSLLRGRWRLGRIQRPSQGHCRAGVLGLRRSNTNGSPHSWVVASGQNEIGGQGVDHRQRLDRLGLVAGLVDGDVGAGPHPGAWTFPSVQVQNSSNWHLRRLFHRLGCGKVVQDRVRSSATKVNTGGWCQ